MESFKQPFKASHIAAVYRQAQQESSELRHPVDLALTHLDQQDCDQQTRVQALAVLLQMNFLFGLGPTDQATGCLLLWNAKDSLKVLNEKKIPLDQRLRFVGCVLSEQYNGSVWTAKAPIGDRDMQDLLVRMVSDGHVFGMVGLAAEAVVAYDRKASKGDFAWNKLVTEAAANWVCREKTGVEVGSGDRLWYPCAVKLVELYEVLPMNECLEMLGWGEVGQQSVRRVVQGLLETGAADNVALARRLVELSQLEWSQTQVGAFAAVYSRLYGEAVTVVDVETVLAVVEAFGLEEFDLADELGVQAKVVALLLKPQLDPAVLAEFKRVFGIDGDR